MNTKRESTCKRLARTFLLGALIGCWTSAGAIGIPTRPLFLADDVPPNVFFALDDSGSMRWTILLRYETLSANDRRALFRNEAGVAIGSRGPLIDFVDDLGRGGETIDFSPNDPEEDLWLCPGHNALAYNPNITYTPWAGEDINGDPFQNASITSARRFPYSPGAGTNNLLAIDGTAYATVYGLWTDTDNDGEYDANECPSGDIAVAPFGNVDGFSGYGTRVPGGAFSDPRFVFVDTLSAAEQQNYANWFSY
ncbi:MAG: hypothetical protein KJO38_02965, partial [Gammaproteobacteria bacterium]|nr:hypothetical protein [Gammaproteobacteria bacterium]